jgi:hypothetical protein
VVRRGGLEEQDTRSGEIVEEEQHDEEDVHERHEGGGDGVDDDVEVADEAQGLGDEDEPNDAKTVEESNLDTM